MQGEDNVEIEKRLKKRGSELGDINIETVVKEKEAIQEKVIKVMLIGKLENPKIECLRELYHAESQTQIVPLGVKKSIALQKFRIPFKNMSPTLDADVEFTFVRTPKSEGEDSCVDLGQYVDCSC